MSFEESKHPRDESGKFGAGGGGSGTHHAVAEQLGAKKHQIGERSASFSKKEDHKAAHKNLTSAGFKRAEGPTKTGGQVGMNKVGGGAASTTHTTSKYHHPEGHVATVRTEQPKGGAATSYYHVAGPAQHANDSGPCAAGVALIRDGDIFLMQRAAGKTYGGNWSLPGGMVEQGEVPDTGACRELYEETGISVDPAALRYAGCNDEVGIDFFTYMASAPDGAEPVMCDEHSSCGWFPLNALPHPLHPGLAKTLEAGLIQRGALAMDSALLAMDKESGRTYDAFGRLRVAECNISKANVCDYFGYEIPRAKELGLVPDKLYKLYRDPVELAKAASTFDNVQLLSTHTRVTADEPKNEYVVGCVGSGARFDPPYLRAPLIIWDNSAIAGVESGEQQQLSSSYKYDVDMTPGEAEGVPYDGRMINIVGNHVALVTVGRAGADVLVGDSKPVELITMKNASPKAVAMRAALGMYLRPQLASDAAPIPLDKLVKPGASALSVARATASHFKGTLDIDPAQLSKQLQLAADEAPAEPEEGAKKPDAEDEDEDEDDKDDKGKKPVAEDEDEDDDKEAMDAAVNKAVAKARAEARELRQAEKDVAPLVGDVAAMDSAEEVYRFALTQAGVDHKGVHASALSALVNMAKSRTTPNHTAPSVAMDGDARAAFRSRYPNARQPSRA